MSVEPDVKNVIIEALRKEGGVATGDRLIYAYIRIKERFRNSRELIGFVKENLADQVEVIEECYTRIGMTWRRPSSSGSRAFRMGRP